MNLRGAKPVVDFSIRQRIESMIPAQDLYNEKLPNEFKDNFFKWIQSSTKNNLKNLWKYKEKRFRFFAGEFMYHKACLKHGAQFKELNADLMRGDALILSVPFSDLGKQHELTEQLLHLCNNLDIPVLLDFAYFPCTQNINLDLSFRCIDTITFSISKAFYGAEFLRVGIRCQRGNADDGIDVFNSVDMVNRVSLSIANTLIKEYGVDHNWHTYEKQYYQVCKEKNLEPTDCIMFGLGGEEYKEFNRGGKVNRVCISELIGEKINDNSK